MKIFVLLLLLIFLSNFSSVYIKQQSRQQYQRLHHLQIQQEKIQIEWGKLQLEYSTLSTPQKITHQASKKLAMFTPSLQQVIFISNNE
jgi:cell division protein FtsL